jgi:MFS family permease
VWVGICLASLQQLVGINVVFYYGAVLWQAVGFTEADALLINVISAVISLAACGATLHVIDRIGRKPLLWLGSIGMTASLCLLTLAFSTAHDLDGGLRLREGMDLLALIAANAYVAFFNATWGPVMWVMLGEMFPNRIRGQALAVAGLFQWGSNFAVTMTFPLLLGGIGLAATYGCYTLATLLSAVFVAREIRETRGLALEQMPG